MRQWRNALWTDESKYEVFGQHCRTFAKRPKDEKMLADLLRQQLSKQGGSFLVRDCFSLSGTGDLVKIEGTMNKQNYREVLEENA